jgi:hypothetical protein
MEVKGDTFINSIPVYNENTDVGPIEFFLNDRIVFGSSLAGGVQIEFGKLLQNVLPFDCRE